MGYTTEFNGQVDIVPPLNAEEVAYIQKFNSSRRMNRTKGPYFVDGTGHAGQGRDADIIDHNGPPDGQPGVWCGWTCNEAGTVIEWDGGEKFYDSAQWMKYIIDHFLGLDPTARRIDPQLSFLQGHVLNGEIFAQGEEGDDRWKLIVSNNKVCIARSSGGYGEPEEV